MNLRKRAFWEFGVKAKCLAECVPVCGREDIAVFQHYNRLILPRNACGIEKIHVVNRLQITRHDQLIEGVIDGDGVIRPWSPARHRMWPEIVERDETVDCRGKRRWNLRIADIRDVGRSVHVEIMDLCVKCCRYLPCWTGEIDHSIGAVDHVDR